MKNLSAEQKRLISMYFNSFQKWKALGESIDNTLGSLHLTEHYGDCFSSQNKKRISDAFKHLYRLEASIQDSKAIIKEMGFCLKSRPQDQLLALETAPMNKKHSKMFRNFDLWVQY